MPIGTVSKMLGHRDINTTRKYIKILDKKVSEGMKMVNKYLPTPDEIAFV